MQKLHAIAYVYEAHSNYWIEKLVLVLLSWSYSPEFLFGIDQVIPQVARWRRFEFGWCFCLFSICLGVLFLRAIHVSSDWIPQVDHRLGGARRFELLQLAPVLIVLTHEYFEIYYWFLSYDISTGGLMQMFVRGEGRALENWWVQLIVSCLQLHQVVCLCVRFWTLIRRLLEHLGPFFQSLPDFLYQLFCITMLYLVLTSLGCSRSFLIAATRRPLFALRSLLSLWLAGQFLIISIVLFVLARLVVDLWFYFLNILRHFKVDDGVHGVVQSFSIFDDAGFPAELLQRSLFLLLMPKLVRWFNRWRISWITGNCNWFDFFIWCLNQSLVIM